MNGSVTLMQGVDFLVTRLWSLVSIETFQRVTGPKVDLWLVNTVGVIVAVILVAVGSAASLAGVDVIDVAKGVMARIDLLDALVEVGPMIWWLIALATS